MEQQKQSMNIQWYPGHMTKTRRMMEEDLKLVDAVCEILDARIPISSRNPDIDAICGTKPRLVILNRIDMADPVMVKRWADYFKSQGMAVLLTDCKSRKGINGFVPAIRQLLAEKLRRYAEKGQVGRPLKIMVVGIPNAGKSTFINTLAGKACAKTGNKPGVTKGKQWIRLNKNIELLDTPGILWPKFEDQLVGLKLAVVGSIKDELLQSEELAMWLIAYLRKEYAGLLTERYQIEEDGTDLEILERIAQSRGCRLKGNLPDYPKTAALIVEDFRSGRLGRITLERPEGV